MAKPNNTLAMPEPPRPRSVIRSVLKSSGMNVSSFVFELSMPMLLQARGQNRLTQTRSCSWLMSAIELALRPAYRAASPATVC